MRILIAYDGSAHADAAIDNLRRAGLPRQCEATVVSVAHRGWPEEKHEAAKGEFDNPWAATLKEAEAMAHQAQTRIQSRFPGWSVGSEALWGDPAKMLLKTIDVWKPDLVVVGSHGRSVPARMFLGSVSTQLLHHASCSVRVVRESAWAAGPLNVLIAIDGSSPAEACVSAVARRSWPEGTNVKVLAVLQTLVPEPTTIPALEGHTFASEKAYEVIEEADEHERHRLHRTLESAAEHLQKAGLSAENVLLDGDPRREIVAEAERWRADCIFVGARGLGAVDRLLMGSVSSAVVAHAPCPVEVCRGFHWL